MIIFSTINFCFPNRFGDLSGSKSSTISSDHKFQINPDAALKLSYSEIEALEKDFVSELNSLRQNPSSYISHLQKELIPQFDGNRVKRRIGNTTYVLETREGCHFLNCFPIYSFFGLLINRIFTGVGAVNQCIDFLRTVR